MEDWAGRCKRWRGRGFGFLVFGFVNERLGVWHKTSHDVWAPGYRGDFDSSGFPFSLFSCIRFVNGGFYAV